ncbi:MAG TPA: ion transporter [Planctomycetota bacterium]|nr:ion transporter [Planctomycetota bacterium]HRR79994.1 ion transporter [Planctomycetota bacterium]HRT93283.1 ion transporter [Planctomycetota bacterium]
MRKRTWEILDVAKPGDKASRAFDIFILWLIAANVVALVLETVRPIHAAAPLLFDGFEVLSVVAFTIEYVLRLWSCTVSERFARPLRGRLRFAVTPMALVDLLAILPFYLPFFGVDLRFVRAVRLTRLFRVMKVARYSEALRTFSRVFRAKKEELLVAAFVMVLLLLFASSLMYFAENEDQPERFSSIPAAMWWGVATLTTVGYGDVCPVTTAGKLIAAIVSVVGIAMFALPTGILGAGFVEEVARKRWPRVCPHCGKELSGREHE